MKILKKLIIYFMSKIRTLMVCVTNHQHRNVENLSREKTHKFIGQTEKKPILSNSEIRTEAENLKIRRTREGEREREREYMHFPLK